MLLWICKLIIFNANCMLTNRTKNMGYELKEIWYYLARIQRMRYVDKQWMLSIQ